MAPLGALRFSMTRPRRVALVAAALVGAGCGASTLRRFPDAPPLWVDDDVRPLAKKPAKYETTPIWDGMDNTVLLPISRALRVTPQGEAVNVNAYDEVPSSSWFSHRLGYRPVTADEVRLGPCEREEAPREPWTLVSAKPDGANPGFIVEDAEKKRYLFKVDDALQPERGTGSDAVSSRVYHAVGYFAPCNRVVSFSRDSFRIVPGTLVTMKDGTQEVLGQKHVDQMWSLAQRLPDGRRRGSLSQFIEGKPIGPWQYIGTRPDDPNDVIPHERRREIRGMFVLDAWLDHIDCREENTMASWIPVGKGGYVRHYMIDFSDTLGAIWIVDSMSRRVGHSHYIDPGHIGGDFVTFGVVSRPWDKAERGASWPVFGYFDTERFVPDDWHPGYPNPALADHTERDAAWMARILTRFGPELQEAAVDAGKWSTPALRAELLRILEGRRRILLERYLGRLSPLGGPEVHGREVCLTDLAVTGGIRAAEGRRYVATTRHPDPRTLAVRTSEKDHVCVVVPENASGADPYLVFDVAVAGDKTGPLRVHGYRREAGAFHVAGLERPEPGSTP